MNENKKTVIITSLITIIVLVLIIGISYAFFTPNITDDTGSEVVVEVATLRLVYSDTEKINLDKAVPGDSISKVLTVYNQGSKTVNYDLIWVELINTFKTKSDIVMSIGCVSDKDSCNSYSQNEIADSGYNIPIMKNIAIEPQETHTYLVTISYLETNVNQDDNQGRTLYGKLGIREYDSYSTDILVYDAAMKIIEDNEGKVVIEGKKNPQTTTVATTDDGMYATIDQDGTTYYFRGAVKNNYLEFSGLTWRVVRINGDGSIRLVLDDMAKNSSGSIIYNGYNSNCTLTSVDSISKTIECVKYGEGEYADYSVKTIVDNWYTSNITTDNLIYINQNTKFCNDYSYSTSNNIPSPYYRLRNEASLTCTTPSGYAGEAKTLTMPVGMLTTDEVAFAGGAISPNNTSYYLYKNSSYWLMSAGFYNYNYLAYVYASGRYILLGNVTSNYAIRPVISLKKEVLLSGTGTIKDPYKVIGINDNSVLSAQYLKINNLSKSNTYATSNTVNLYALANSATEMCFSNTSSNTGCTWVPYTPNAYSWNLTSGDGIKTVYAWYKDSLGNITEPISQSITVDTVAPVLSYFRINNSTTSQTVTNNTTLTFYLSATDNPTQMCITTSSTNTNCVWKTYANSSLQAISTTNGTRIYYAWVKDIAGNISSVVSQSITLDTVAPVISYLRVNSATTSASRVGSTSINLYTSGTGTPSQMCFSNTSSNSGCTWVTYSTSAQAWNLTTGEGIKTVYAWFKDNAGNISEPISQSTTVDTTPPIATYLRIDNPSTSITKSVSGDTIKLYSSVSGSPTQVCLSNSSTNNNCTWVSYNTAGNSYKLPSTTGNYTIYAWFKDEAGNVSSRVSATTTLYAPTDSSCFTYDSTSTKITGYYCYEGNSKGLPTITDVIIPSTVTSIENIAFRWRILTSVVIPNSVTTIGSQAFELNLLTSVTIGNSVTSIGDSAFNRNQLTSVTIGNSVTSIGAQAFHNNKLTSVIIPSSVTTIWNSAFQKNQLTSVTIPNSVTFIGDSAFRNNKLTSIDYPGGINISGAVFNENPIISDEPFYYYKNKDGTYDKTILMGYINDGTSSVIIPDTVKTIKDCSLEEENLTSVTIPNSVTSIGDLAFAYNNLTGVTIPNSVTTIENGAFYNNKLTSVTIGNSVTQISSQVFQYNQLTSVTIPNSVKTIGYSAFNSNQLTSVTIPNSVTFIDSSAFAYNSLTSVKIGSGVKTIGTNAFYKSTTDNSNPNLSLIEIDNVSGAISGSPWGATGVTITYLR